MIAARRIDEVEESTNTKKLNIKIEMPSETLMPNYLFDDSKDIINDIGVEGFAILLILAKNKFGFLCNDVISIKELSERICTDENAVEKFCKRMERKKYILMDDGHVQL